MFYTSHFSSLFSLFFSFFSPFLFFFSCYSSSADAITYSLVSLPSESLLVSFTAAQAGVTQRSPTSRAQTKSPGLLCWSPNLPDTKESVRSSLFTKTVARDFVTKGMSLVVGGGGAFK